MLRKVFDPIHTLDQKRMENLSPIMNLKFSRNTKPITLFGFKIDKTSYVYGIPGV